MNQVGPDHGLAFYGPQGRGRLFTTASQVQGEKEGKEGPACRS